MQCPDSESGPALSTRSMSLRIIATGGTFDKHYDPISGNLVFLLVSPLSHWAWFVAYVGASVVRGLVVGAGVLLVTLWISASLEARLLRSATGEIASADTSDSLRILMATGRSSMFCTPM